jgi:hypothetical protein
LPSNFESKALTKLIYRTNVQSNATFATIYTAQAHAVYPMKEFTKTVYFGLGRENKTKFIQYIVLFFFAIHFS